MSCKGCWIGWTRPVILRVQARVWSGMRVKIVRSNLTPVRSFVIHA